MGVYYTHCGDMASHREEAVEHAGVDCSLNRSHGWRQMKIK